MQAISVILKCKNKKKPSTTWNIKIYAQLVAVKALHYLLEKMTCANIETFILMTYGYNKFEILTVQIECSCIMHIKQNIVEMKETCNKEKQMVTNSYDNSSEVDNNNEASVANRDTMLDSTTMDMQSLTYTYTPGEAKFMFSLSPCGIPVLSQKF